MEHLPIINSIIQRYHIVLIGYRASKESDIPVYLPLTDDISYFIYFHSNALAVPKITAPARPWFLI